MAQVNCPASEGCTVKQTYYTLWNWTCNAKQATMQCKAKVLCQKAGGTAPSGVTPPSAPLTAGGTTMVSGETKTFDDFIGDGEVIKAYFNKGGDVWSIDCNKQILGCLVYQEATQMVGGGGAPANYSDYVDRANQYAQLVAAQYSCKPNGTKPCKATVTIVRDEWSYSSSKELVIVKVYFQVDCK